MSEFSADAAAGRSSPGDVPPGSPKQRHASLDRSIAAANHVGHGLALSARLAAAYRRVHKFDFQSRSRRGNLRNRRGFDGAMNYYDAPGDRGRQNPLGP